MDRKMADKTDDLPLSEEQIQDLIKKVLKGDKSSFSLIVKNFQDQIYRTVLAQVGEPTMAKDISQDTFIRAYKYLNTFKAESSFKTWLTRIALNNVKTYFSSATYKRLQKSESFKTQEHERPVSTEAESGGDQFSENLLNAMRQEISNLKDKYKDVLVMKTFQGLSYKEIAIELNIPVGTVSSRMNSALLALRSKLSEVQ